MADDSTADEGIMATAGRLEDLKKTLGPAYWSDVTVHELQGELRRQIGAYAAWGSDRPPLHRRARDVAKLEQQYARLLWPGIEDG